MIHQLCEFLKFKKETKLVTDIIKTMFKHSETLDQFNSLGATAFELKEYGVSVDIINECLNHVKDPEQRYSLMSNLVIAYSQTNYPEKALTLIEDQEKLVPFDKERELKKVYCLYLSNKKKEAEALLRSIDTTKVTQKVKDEIEFNLGTYDMLNGDFHKGLDRFLTFGRKLGVRNTIQLTQYPEWKIGQNIKNCNLIVMGEGGIGDEIINIRFFDHLRSDGIKPIWVTHRKDVVELFERNGYPVRSEVPKNMIGGTYWCHAMNLPLLLDLNYDDLWIGNYLTPNKTNNFQSKRLKIGLRWQGNAHYENDLHRTVPFKEMFKALGGGRDHQLYSFQRDDGVEELENISESSIYPLHKYGFLDTLESTLSSLNEMDVIVTSCTSIAHMAGAIGKRTFVLSPISSYYIWCNPDGKQPWYGDHLTLIKQEHPRQWTKELDLLKSLI